MMVDAVARRAHWVVKVGSALVTNDGQGLDHRQIAEWVDQLAELRNDGVRVTLVSSGAVAAGMQRLGWLARPRELYRLQAAAAVGQTDLVGAWERAFGVHGIGTAQVLLTHDDLSDRRRYLNARITLRTLLELGLVPIVNENDTVANEEFQLSDNDTLAALVTNLLEADRLVILTDQQGLFDADPRSVADARLVTAGLAGDPALEALCGDSGSGLGRGGMRSKLRAAGKAARSGAATVIAAGREPGVLLKLARGEAVGTLLEPGCEPLAARKRWLAGQLVSRGRLILDDGAVRVLRRSGRSLLPVGVLAVEGRFRRGEIVICVDQSGAEVGRGLVNYDAREARMIAGQPSARIEELLGYVDEPELIHRDNFVLT